MIKSLAPLSVISLIIYLFYAYLMPSNHTWLHGEWALFDSAEEATLVFHKNGTVDMKSDDGSFTCIYGYLATKVSMQCDMMGAKRELRYKVNSDRTVLSSSKQKSRYAKVSGPQARI
ncbi:MAG: hypothetical protein AAF438_17025 [Pseudomonadota bacterium]